MHLCSEHFAKAQSHGSNNIIYCVYFKTFSSKQKIKRKLVKSPPRNLVIRASFLHTEKGSIERIVERGLICARAIANSLRHLNEFSRTE